jgi:hypothetical protein
MSDIIESITEIVKVVVTGGNVSDMALRTAISNLLLKVSSKWELRRLSTAVNATALVRLGANARRNGLCECETGRNWGRIVTVFTGGKKKHSHHCHANYFVRFGRFGARRRRWCQSRCGVQRRNRLVYGGGAVEMALSVAFREAEQVPGLEQYALAAAGKAGSGTALAENAGWNATRVSINK